MERIPSRWRYSIFAFVIWLFLVAYILWTGNVYGYIIIALFGIFIVAPLLVLVLGNRGKLKGLLDQDERPTTHAREDRLVPLEQTADPNMLN